MKSFVIGICLFLASCTSFTGPRNIDDGLAYAMGQVTAMVNTCTALAEQERFEKRDVELCLAYTDDARADIELARTLKDPIEKQDKLNAALDLLRLLEQSIKAAQ